MKYSFLTEFGVELWTDYYEGKSQIRPKMETKEFLKGLTRIFAQKLTEK